MGNRSFGDQANHRLSLPEARSVARRDRAVSPLVICTIRLSLGYIRRSTGNSRQVVIAAVNGALDESFLGFWR